MDEHNNSTAVNQECDCLTDQQQGHAQQLRPGELVPSANYQDVYASEPHMMTELLIRQQQRAQQQQQQQQQQHYHRHRLQQKQEQQHKLQSHIQQEPLVTNYSIRIRMWGTSWGLLQQHLQLPHCPMPHIKRC
jgi:ABC-type glutathione transport system ATPase component